MTEIAYTANYVTQEQLQRAYARLGHTSPTPKWAATLLIRPSHTMAWACPVLASDRTEEHPALYDWHVIAEAGELDWPPLRPEEDI
ncbi:Transcriptional regulator OS=Streptomyces griseomycini OX=66895 GN=FHS37_006701 PE=4 SV=1 [Streptomyces griseomycini]